MAIAFPWARRTLIRFLLCVLLVFVVACDDDSTDGAATSQCGADASPTQLASRLDDDDGDGNPIDEDFPTINDEDDDIADHAWIEDRSGTYHLFFHGENLFHPNQIEHYTTRDFQSLDYAGVALTVNPGGWDSDALWAPHVVEHDRTYYMFYTGVAGNGAGATQRIGLATSTDLVTWTRAPLNRCAGTDGDGCVYDCDEPWTTWGDAGTYNDQCRDPFVMWDANTRRWLMFATARSVNQFGAVTVASAEDLSTWTGEGFIDATRRLANGVGAQTTGGQAENPFVVSRDDAYYLFFTDWEDPEDSVSVVEPRTIAQYATSASLDTDAAGGLNWTYRGYIPDPGVNAIEVIELRRFGVEWIMSQSISNRSSGVPKKERRQLRIKCVTWGDDFSVETSNWGRSENSSGVTDVGVER